MALTDYSLFFPTAATKLDRYVSFFRLVNSDYNVWKCGTFLPILLTYNDIISSTFIYNPYIFYYNKIPLNW